MKIELEWPEDEIIFKYLHGPQMMGGPAYRHLPDDHASRPYSVYVKSVKSPTYYGATGFGMTPQAAMNDALRQVREYVARNPKGAYNVNAGGVSLDLDFLKDF